MNKTLEDWENIFFDKFLPIFQELYYLEINIYSKKNFGIFKVHNYNIEGLLNDAVVKIGLIIEEINRDIDFWRQNNIMTKDSLDIYFRYYKDMENHLFKITELSLERRPTFLESINKFISDI